MSHLQKILLDIILEKDFNEKIRKATLAKNQKPETLTPLTVLELEKIKSPGRPSCFLVVSPRDVPSRRDISKKENRINFLHALANIELLAIELPALALLRFGCNDVETILSSLKIIAEEAYHFKMLCDCLKEQDSEFGKLPVHHGLWDYAWRCESLIEHQIIIPCYLEARGLDVTQNFVDDFKKINEQNIANTIEIIHRDEIGHVKAGIDFLTRESKNKNVTIEQLYDNVLTKFFSDKKRSKIKLNLESRKKAGFTQGLIDIIS